MTVKSKGLLLLLLLLGTSLSCVDGNGDPPRWDLCPPAKKAQSPGPPVRATENIVVYLDTSASMAGYVSPNGKASFALSPDGTTIFSKALLELRSVVTMMSPQPQVAVRRVESTVLDPTLGDLALSQAAVNRGLYAGTETNLAGAIKSFSEPLDPEAEDPSPPRFHILVTDGVQSSAEDNADVNCLKGSDAVCVKKQLLDLMNGGWGGAILGMRSEFQGNLYSEVARRAVPFASGKDANRFRPFYLYVFSPDRAALDGLLGAMRQRLAPLGREDALREYTLTGDYVGGAAAVEVAQEKGTRELLEARLEKAREGQNARLTVKTNLDTETAGAQQFSVAITPSWSAAALKGGSPDELAGLIRWDLNPAFPEQEKAELRYPNFRLVRQEVKNGRAVLTFESGWTKDTGSTAWRMYCLVGRIDVERSAPPWVMAWSTPLDTTAESGNRTLNIESTLANLWKNDALKDAAVAEIGVRVGRK